MKASNNGLCLSQLPGGAARVPQDAKVPRGTKRLNEITRVTGKETPGCGVWEASWQLRGGKARGALFA